MDDVITRLKDAEKSAQDLVAAARQRAAKAAADADKKSAERKESLLNQAVEDSKKMRADAVSTAEQEKSRLLTQLEKELDASLNGIRNKIPAVADSVLKELLKFAHD
ncbi:hypothetical protein KDK77_01875 [bacterium]|nr:hypothetical protein [bacterium]